MKTKKTAVMGLLLALTFALSAVETAVSMGLPAGVRIGLANIVVMLALLSMGKKEALTIVVAKSVFILITKGVTAFMLSLCGGVASFIAVLLLIKSEKNSLILISVAGALVHNIAQLIAASLILKNINTLFYAPVLIIAGVIAGSATGTVIKIALPAVTKAVNDNK
ncbi:MAG: Gx transporter family protein [Oscillospiraceae bacterium]